MKPDWGPVTEYSLELIAIERDARTIYKLRMRWKNGVTGWSATGWRIYHKTWKYKVLDNAIRKILTLSTAYGKPQTLNVMGYLAQEGPPDLSGPAEPR